MMTSMARAASKVIAITTAYFPSTSHLFHKTHALLSVVTFYFYANQVQCASWRAAFPKVREIFGARAPVT